MYKKLETETDIISNIRTKEKNLRKAHTHMHININICVYN